jgi:6-phosphogluconate dehydrogenase
MPQQADIGLIGLAVMGENIVLNMASKGFTVACYNRTLEKVDAFVAGRAKGQSVIGCHSIKDLTANLKHPRKVMMLVKAGPAVDELIEQLLPDLELSSTVATAILPTRSAASSTSRARGCSTSARACRGVRRAR